MRHSLKYKKHLSSYSKSSECLVGGWVYSLQILLHFLPSLNNIIKARYKYFSGLFQYPGIWFGIRPVTQSDTKSLYFFLILVKIFDICFILGKKRPRDCFLWSLTKPDISVVVLFMFFLQKCTKLQIIMFPKFCVQIL